MRFRLRALMAAGAMIIVGWMVVAALKWPLKTALFPVVIGIPVFFLSAVELMLCLSPREDGSRERKGSGMPSGEEEQPAPTRKIIGGFLLGVGFFVLILLFSFPVAIPLFVFLYVKVYGKERWGTTLALTAAAWVGFYGLFVSILHIPFGRGLLQMGLKSLGIL
jgi:hypothetical protein